MKPTRSDGKILLKRPEGDSATITLRYPRADAERMRATATGISFEGRKVPLSMFASRSLTIYLDGLALAKDQAPDQYAGELRVLRSMLTDVPKPKPATARKKCGT